MPSTILSDNGVTSGSAGLKTTAASDGALALQTTTAGGAATTALTIDTSQNVGIGTSSPTAPLHVSKTSGDSLITSGLTYPLTIYTNQASSNPAIYWKTATGALRFGVSTDGISPTGFSEYMRIDSSGNVGIGTTAPQQRLGIKAASNVPQLYLIQDNVANDGWKMFADSSAGYLSWLRTSSGSDSEKMRLTLNGTVVLAGGSTSATGVGITFPATQSASSDANTLDDYEEGSWSPSVGGNATYTVQEGQYIKIGQLVFIFFDIGISTIGTGSTTQISGAPFTAANIPNVSSAWTLNPHYFANIANSITWLSSYIIENATTINFVGNSTAATTVQMNGGAVFGNGARIVGSGTYRASA